MMQEPESKYTHDLAYIEGDGIVGEHDPLRTVTTQTLVAQYHRIQLHSTKAMQYLRCNIQTRANDAEECISMQREERYNGWG